MELGKVGKVVGIFLEDLISDFCRLNWDTVWNMFEYASDFDASTLMLMSF